MPEPNGSASRGCSLAPDHKTDADTLSAEADTVLIHIVEPLPLNNQCHDVTGYLSR